MTELGYSKKVVPHGKQGRRGTSGHPNLGVNVLDVVANGLRREVKSRGHVADRVPTGHKAEHVHLALTQSSWKTSLPRQTPMASGTECRIGSVSVESSGQDLSPCAFGGRLRREGWTVRTRLDFSVEKIRGSEDARSHRN
jgi:hypothetical protein